MSELQGPDSYSFEVGGGRTLDERFKPHWPAGLYVYMTRQDALDLLISLANQLGRADEEEISVFWPGKLVQNEDEDEDDEGDARPHSAP